MPVSKPQGGTHAARMGLTPATHNPHHPQPPKEAPMRLEWG